MPSSWLVIMVVVLWGMGSSVALMVIFLVGSLLAISITEFSINLTVRRQWAGSDPSSARSVPLGEDANTNAIARDGVRHQSDRNDNQRSEGGTLAALPIPRQAIVTAGDLVPMLEILQRSPVEIFPPNRIATRCKSCRKIIARFTGYQHYQVGERGTYCPACHQARGLPLRDAADDAKFLPKGEERA